MWVQFKDSVPISSIFRHNMNITIYNNSQLLHFTVSRSWSMLYSEYCCQDCTASINAVQLQLHIINRQLHWLPVWQQITYKLAILPLKICHIAARAYWAISSVITALLWAQSALLCGSTFHNIIFWGWAFCCAARTIWNSAEHCDSCWLTGIFEI